MKVLLVYLGVLGFPKFYCAHAVLNLKRSVLPERNPGNSKNSDGSLQMAWTGYQTLETMYAWIQGLSNHTNANVTKVGTSSEDRPIYLVKVSTGPHASGNPKMAIFLDSNIHANEWISSAAVTYIINELITNPDSHRELLDEVDLYFIPMANPDGYEYTHAFNRTWRKTRSINDVKLPEGCQGADPNRNFEFMWAGESTSADPCSSEYHGSTPWSEPEVRAIRDAMTMIRSGGQEIQAYIAIHACGNVWLLSWGWTQGVYPEDFQDLLAWGTSVIAKIQEVHGTVYETGQGAELFYGVGGASDDYARSVGIKYTATAELRCATGDDVMDLPSDQIIPTAEELLAGIKETARTISFGIFTASPVVGKWSLSLMTGILYTVTH